MWVQIGFWVKGPCGGALARFGFGLSCSEPDRYSDTTLPSSRRSRVYGILGVDGDPIQVPALDQRRRDNRKQIAPCQARSPPGSLPLFTSPSRWCRGLGCRRGVGCLSEHATSRCSSVRGLIEWVGRGSPAIAASFLGLRFRHAVEAVFSAPGVHEAVLLGSLESVSGRHQVSDRLLTPSPCPRARGPASGGEPSGNSRASRPCRVPRISVPHGPPYLLRALQGGRSGRHAPSNQSRATRGSTSTALSSSRRRRRNHRRRSPASTATSAPPGVPRWLSGTVCASPAGPPYGYATNLHHTGQIWKAPSNPYLWCQLFI